MITQKKKILQTLLRLKNECGMVAVKAEFEAEGSRLDELIMLNEIIFRANTDLIIKIGGCEAIRDIDQCKLLGASGVMAPMIETPFAMKKFKEAGISKYGEEVNKVEWIINAETITCYNNFDLILNEGGGFIKTVVVGRSDLSASMELDRNLIDGDKLFDIVLSFSKQAHLHGMKASFGGGVSIDSIPFIMNLGDNIDQYETRKVVLKRPENVEEAKMQINTALEFEMQYLQYKRDFYSNMANEDQRRLYSLEQRFINDGIKIR